MWPRNGQVAVPVSSGLTHTAKALHLNIVSITVTESRRSGLREKVRIQGGQARTNSAIAVKEAPEMLSVMSAGVAEEEI